LPFKNDIVYSVAGGIYGAIFGRLFTVWYGATMRRIDELGLREVRREVLAEAAGRTLDLGTGTGSNLSLFPGTVEELVLAEPDRHMRKVLERKLAAAGARSAELIGAPAERLPFESSSFDCVSCTMVLCTVPDPAAALMEVARVLKPGGKLLFLEHVRSEDPVFARRQDRAEKPWRFVADGCHCNRDSLATIESSAFEVEALKRGVMPAAPMIMKPLIYGSARLSA
jgi:ubiquinone/menaquinone biosynthesis C-methylase UbiE